MYLHVGLHKTATTFLQKLVFPRLEGLAYLGKGNQLDIESFYRSRHEQFLISREGMLVKPFAIEGEGWIDDFRANLSKLLKRFPRSRFMISFRRHEGFVTSMYKEYLRRPLDPELLPCPGTRHLSIERFFDVEEDRGILKKRDLVYRSYVDALTSLTDREPFVQEELSANLRGLLQDMCAFLGVDTSDMDDVSHQVVRRGLGHYEGQLWRRIHQLDGFLRRSDLLPSLYHPALFHLSIVPARIMIRRLRFLSRRPIKVSQRQQDFIRSNYGEDWNYIMNYIEMSRNRVIK